MSTSIKDWPEQERPRERLLLQGAQSLSDAELLAIFLRSGSQRHSAVELARIMIQHFGGLNPIMDAPLNELQQFHGIGASKYSQLMAVKELGRRYLEGYFHQQQLDLSSSSLVQNYLRYELIGESSEVFAVLCLDSELRKLHFKKLFLGSLHDCGFSMNTFLRHIIQHKASSVVIAHNHPHGDAQPSPLDLQLTDKIAQTCQLVDIHLIDHCIIARQHSFSFAEHQLLPRKNTA